MCCIPDNYDAFSACEAKRERWLDKLPRCSECDEPIQEDYCYEINGEYICEHCMNDNHKVSTENLMD